MRDPLCVFSSSFLRSAVNFFFESVQKLIPNPCRIGNVLHIQDFYCFKLNLLTWLLTVMSHKQLLLNWFYYLLLHMGFHPKMIDWVSRIIYAALKIKSVMHYSFFHICEFESAPLGEKKKLIGIDKLFNKPYSTS